MSDLFLFQNTFDVVPILDPWLKTAALECRQLNPTRFFLAWGRSTREQTAQRLFNHSAKTEPTSPGVCFYFDEQVFIQTNGRSMHGLRIGSLT